MQRAFKLLILTVLGVMLHVSSLTAGSILLGWNNLGMHCMDSSYSEFSILPPYNTIEAQLIVGGKLVASGSGYTITYEAVADPDGSINSTSVNKGNWSDFAALIYGKQISSADEGLNAWSMPGLMNIPQAMLFETANSPAPGATALVNWFRAEGIPITPYDDAGNKNPYPLMRLVARDATTNSVVAKSDIVLPVSDEMDCRTCHGANTVAAATPTSGWITDPTNPGREYRLNILQLHDDRQFANYSGLYNDALAAKGLNPAGLYATVTAGRPILCASCHSSEALGTPSFSSARGSVPPLTTSMHSKHAGVMDPEYNITLDSAANRDACYRCHPGSATRCLRGAMGSAVAVDGTMAMQCQSCHGTMSQVGASTRVGWFMEPKCQSCHTGTATVNNGQIRYPSVFDPATGQERVPVDTTFATSADTPAAGISLYRFSTGHGGLQCSACHGSTHAEFPASHRNDNIRNIQLQGHAGVMVECASCHTAGVPASPNGGPHGMHPVGQSWVSSHHDQISAAGGRTACQSCHGADYRGTELSRVQSDTRTLSFRGSQVNTFRGATIGCFTCHMGANDDATNTATAPFIADITGQTMASNSAVNYSSVSMILPGAAAGVTLRVISQPKNGSVGISDGIATYFPFYGFTGSDSFTFAGYDGAKNSTLATGSVQVSAYDSAVIPPAVTTDPVGQTVIQGTTVTLAVAATGSSPVYQWYKDGLPLAGATSATLTLAGSVTDGGSYRVLVSNAAGAKASAAATVTILIPPTIVTAPASQTVVMPARVSLSVTAAGTAPFSYQWYKDGVAISRANSATLSLGNVTLASSGAYYVRVTNIAGAVDSAVATLLVQSAPVISTQPKTTSVTVGSPVTLSVTATGTDPMTYQWVKDTVAISGATGTSYAITAATVADAGIYSVVITNPIGTTTSFGAQVSVTPLVTSITPALASPGMSVVIAGASFTGVSGVTFNGVAAAFIVDSDTQITAVVPAGLATGRATVGVAGPGGTATSSAFTVVPVPTIATMNPASGPAGTVVTLTGIGYSGTVTVAFNGVPSATVKANAGGTSLTAAVPASATTGPVTVTAAGGTVTSATPFTVTYPPAITSFTPATAGAGGVVTITGINFTTATEVAFSGVVAAGFTVLSDTQIAATVPVAAGSGRISVTNSYGTATSATKFTFIPPPAVTGFSPAGGPVGTRVNITGTSFTAPVSVSFNGIPAVTVTGSGTSVTATVPAGASSGPVSVTTPGGSAFSAAAYTVTSPPVVTSFNPASAGVGATIIINGANFTTASSVAFNGIVTSAFTVLSDSSITATVPVGATTGKVSVTNPDATATSAASFTVIPAPVVTGFSPVSGPVGTKVTITGTNLSGATKVSFNGVAGTALTLTSGTSISATVPAGAASGTISVSTPGGTATSAGSYTVTVPPPAITAISPASGAVGTMVTLTGTNFTGATGVKFNTTAAVSFNVISATSLTVLVPSGAATGKISVTTPGGTASSTASFTVLGPPTITSFNPVSGPVGTKVTITGTNLTGATSIKFNGTAATAVTLTSATSISATVPAGATTGTISVTTPVGTVTSATSYAVTIPAPTVKSAAPTSGGVGTTVTLTGTNFTGATAVSFNGTAAPFTVISATSIVTSVPSGAKTGKISVTTPGGTVSSTANFTVGTTAVLPAITSFTPASAAVGAVVTVTGTNLGGVTAVTLGTVAASFKVLSGTSLTFTVPAGSISGTTATITVTTAGGIKSSTGTLAVL